MRSGAYDFVAKPFEAAELAERRYAYDTAADLHEQAGEWRELTRDEVRALDGRSTTAWASR